MPKSADNNFSTYTSMMRVTSKGRPYTKDLYDMFSAVLLQVTLSDHRVMFRTYKYTFTTDEAAKVMSSLVFIHVHRHPDPANPERQVATRTTTTFSMDYATAKNMIQHFLSARLIMSATDPTNWNVRDKGLWCPTLKGKYVLEEFTDYTQTEMTATLITALNAPYMSPGTSGSTGSRIITLDRLTDNDDLITFSRPNMTAAFKAMMSSLPHDALLMDEVGGLEKKNLSIFQHTFVGLYCVEWLCDRLTVTSKEEAEMVAAEFVLFGWIAQVLDKSDRSHVVKNDMMTFKTSRNSIYYVTDRGCSIIGWKIPLPTPDENTVQEDTNSGIVSGLSSLDELDSSSIKLKPMSPRRVVIHPTKTPSNKVASEPIKQTNFYQLNKSEAPVITRHDSATALDDPHSLLSKDTVSLEHDSHTLSARPSSMALTNSTMSQQSNTSVSVPSATPDNSQFTKLNQILETPLLRMYFRDFLRKNYCVENINFWVDHHILLNKSVKKKNTLDQISECYSIYETYLGPYATADVNIDHTLRQEIIKYVSGVFIIVSQLPSPSIEYFMLASNSTSSGKNYNKSAKSTSRLLLLSPQAGNIKQRIITIRGTDSDRCLVKLMTMFSRVNDHVCRMMAEDSVPKFTKTSKYKELILQQQQVAEEQEDDDDYDDDSEGYFDDESDDDVIPLTTALSEQRTSVEIQRDYPLESISTV